MPGIFPVKVRGFQISLVRWTHKSPSLVGPTLLGPHCQFCRVNPGLLPWAVVGLRAVVGLFGSVCLLVSSLSTLPFGHKPTTVYTFSVFSIGASSGQTDRTTPKTSAVFAAHRVIYCATARNVPQQLFRVSSAADEVICTNSRLKTAVAPANECLFTNASIVISLGMENSLCCLALVVEERTPAHT